MVIRRDAGNWAMDVADKVAGKEIFVSTWAAEKLCQVVQGLIAAIRTNTYEAVAAGDDEDEMVLVDSLNDAYRNCCKLATWLGGNNNYDEGQVQEVYSQGGNAMRELVERYLGLV
jgi:hypothetical protein